MASEPPSSSTTGAVRLSLLNRVAIITGASRGIGRAIALHLASLGARVAINYTSPSSQPLADSLAAEINSLPLPSLSPRAAAIAADVSDESAVASLFDAAERAFSSPPHIVVTSAGVLDPRSPPITDTEASDFDRIFAVNARGTFLCLREAGRVVRGGGGRVVALSSSLATALRPNTAAYAASKAAVEAMARIMAREMKGSGVTVNCVAPGPVATEMFFDGKSEERIQMVIDECPLGRLGQVGDVAPVVGFLVSDAGEWVNGQVIRVNGGYI